MKIEFCTSVPMFFGNEPSPTGNAVRQQQIARLEREGPSERQLLREIAVGRISNRKNKYFLVRSKSDSISERLTNALSSYQKIKYLENHVDYELRDHFSFMFNIFTTIELDDFDSDDMDRIVSIYQEVFPPLFSFGKIPDGLPVLEQSALDELADFSGIPRGKARVADVTLSGSYAEYFAIFLNGKSGERFSDFDRYYKIKEGESSADVEFGSSQKARVVSGYSIFGIITDESIDAYQVFKEMVFHVNYHWNLIRDLRDGLQRRFVDLISEGGKAKELAGTIRKIDAHSDLIRALIYESDSISVCEWAHERNLYQLIWDGWGGDELVGATSGFIEDVKSSVSRRYDEETSKYEKVIQFFLFFITILTIASTLFQTVDFYSSKDDPGIAARHIFFGLGVGVLVLLTLASYLFYLFMPRKS